MTYQTQGVCSKEIRLDIDQGVIKSIAFANGCEGNLKGLSRLVTGMKVTDVIERVKGIRCGSKSTSCPDQLAKALEQWLVSQSNA